MKLPKMPKISLPKMPKSVSKVLENQYVLYFVFFLALTNLFGYMILGNIHAIIFFIIAGFVCSFFTKNMILILSIPIVLTSVLMIGQKVKESFQNSSDSSMPTSSMPTSSMPTSSMPTVSVPKKNNVDIVYPVDQEPNEDSMIPLDSAQIPESSSKVDEPMTTMYKKNKRIDYASTVEDAYSDLNNILGGDGIKNLTADTQKLMNQQLQLADAMKSMTPLLESAKGLLQGFDMKNLNSLSSLAKNFNMTGGSVPASVSGPASV
jgi:hypothetical protein